MIVFKHDYLLKCMISTVKTLALRYNSRPDCINHRDR